MALTDAQRTINEGNSFVYTATLLDENSTAIPLSVINSLTLTLFDAGTGTIINNRNGQDVLNTNQVTVHATSGLLTWAGLPADNAIVDSGKVQDSLEQHVALFRVVYSSTKALNHILELYIRQLLKVG